MKLIVTGSLGMVGRHFMKAAKERGHTVLGIDKKAGLGLNSPELKPLIAKRMPDFDMVVHLAATCSTSKSLVNPGQDFIDNVLATFQVMELCRTMKKPVLYTSTCKIHPDEKGMRTPYGMTKWMGEEIMQEWRHSFGIPFVINRPGTIYGPHQDASTESGWLAWFIKAAKEQEPITIYGTGEQQRDVLFVDDYVALLLDQVENFAQYEGKTFDVGGGFENAVTLLEVLEFLEYNNFNKGKKRLGDVDKFVSGNEEVTAINGWKPKVGWKDGIKRVQDFLNQEPTPEEQANPTKALSQGEVKK